MSIFNPSKPVLVYSANGVQGGAVVRALLRRGLKVRALVRDLARAHNFRWPGVEWVQGDLNDPLSLEAANSDIFHAVIQIPIGSEDRMRAQGENVITAATDAGLKSIILKLASASRTAPCEEPSFVANDMIETVVRRSGLPCTVVRPTMYLDNLLKPSALTKIIEKGIFAPPIAATQKIAWTSADDCGEAAVVLLANGTHGGDYRIAGPESVNGDELAARITEGLGRPVIYQAQQIEAFEADVDRAMGQDTGRRIGSKFRFFAAHSDEADKILADPFHLQPGLEEFRPTSIKGWIQGHQTDFAAS